MIIHFLPLSISGACDIKTNDIFISSKYRFNIIIDTIIHEISHLITKSSNHNKEWVEIYKSIHPLHKNPIINNIDHFGEFALNIGNITGIQQLLTDYHMLLSYRKFAQRVLGIEGEWEYKVSTNTIRLFPLPKGSFPVIIQYIPIVDTIDSPQAQELLNRAIVAYTKIIVGHARKKYGGLPSPDGGTINMDGAELVTSGEEAIKNELIEFAKKNGEPLKAYLF